MDSPHVKLDILSDPVCPWCLIGTTNLMHALEAHPDHPFAVEWHPYQLNPDLPPEGMARGEWLASKFGAEDRGDEVHARIDTAARAAGLTIAWKTIERMPNTLDAHRVIHWAGLEGRQTPMARRIFRAYWQEGRDIGDAGTLAELAAEAGLDREMVAMLLAGDADREAVAARALHARERGVTGVPTFIVAGRHVVTGAQPESLWAEVIADIGARLHAAP